MTLVEKAQKWLEYNDIECKKMYRADDSKSLAVILQDFSLELSKEEIDYRAELYDELKEINPDM